MKKFIFFILFIVSGLNSFSQENTRVTGNFHDISFIEFVEFIENETVYKFYYEEKWVEGISINLSLDNQEVNSFLQRILNNNNLSYFIDADYQIIIYPGEIITSKIPSFIANIQIAGESESIDDQLTDREKKYIEGQKKINIQEFIVGNPNENNRNIACILNGRIISKQSGEPIIGATIFIKELSKGAVTDLDGYFKLSVKPGRYEMVANSLSMKEEQFIVNVHSTGFFSIELEKELMNINEVRIVADKNSNVRGIQMGYERLTAVTIKEIPAVMG
ncbi:MAG: carboxypeptidase-like regulatory domain-containing protein, partial [Bacteroidales bacterium]|nr:carboxypeptidase-like regulatory domain-containing protein [Bacteroidales bacterium]